MVERQIRGREVVGSNPGLPIPKALKMVPVATLLGAQHYKASTGSPPTTNTTNIAQKLTKKQQKTNPSTWFPGTRLMSPSVVKTYMMIEIDRTTIRLSKRKYHLVVKLKVCNVNNGRIDYCFRVNAVRIIGLM